MKTNTMTDTAKGIKIRSYAACWFFLCLGLLTGCTHPEDALFGSKHGYNGSHSFGLKSDGTSHCSAADYLGYETITKTFSDIEAETGLVFDEQTQSTLHLRYYLKEKPNAVATIIFYQGNLLNACEQIYMDKLFEKSEDSTDPTNTDPTNTDPTNTDPTNTDKYNMVFIEYQGYSRDRDNGAPRPGETLMLKNANAAYTYLSATLSEVPIFVLGRSLGAAVATHVAKNNNQDSLYPLEGLLLLTASTSFKNSLKHYGLDFFLSAHPFEAYKWAPEVTSPMLNQAASNDEFVPRKVAQEQHDNFTKVPWKTLTIIDGTTHNDINLDIAFYKNSREFISKVLTDNLN